jgi:heptosyltransferase-1/heptosyltransferase-2
LRAEKFDTAFLLHRSMTRALMVFLAGIPRRVGYSKTKGLLTHPVAMSPEDIHRSDYYLKVLEGFGIKIEDRLYELRLKIEDIQALDEKLNQAGVGPNDKYVVLNTGGNWDLKRWPSENFIVLAGRLKEFGLKIVFAGSDKDGERCEIMREGLGPQAINLAGQTNLGQSLALYKRAMCVISNDTGPLHLAHSVGADVIGIYGPTRPEITGPRGRGLCQVLFKDVGCNKAPCYHLSCSNNVCMQSVTVEDVFQAFKKICA